MVMQKIAHPSIDERGASGKEARNRTPLSSHQGYRPAADRPDPVVLLEEQSLTREPDLVPVRHGRTPAHARSGDPVAVDGYLGGGDASDLSLTDFSQRYADQDERDYRSSSRRSGPGGWKPSNASEHLTSLTVAPWVEEPVRGRICLASRRFQEERTMLTALPESSVTAGVCSLEVRWIFPGRLEPAVAGWFGRFPARTEAREDNYLLDPRLPGLSVKVRAGGTLEVKVYRGSPGILDVGGRARGRMESWQKWSFPFSPLRRASAALAGWRPVGKRRRISRFSLASGRVVASAPGLAGRLGCAVELTEVRTRGEAWWTLGLEATGPADQLRSGLEATAAVVFAHAVPGEVALGPDDSRSYAEWLDQKGQSRR